MTSGALPQLDGACRGLQIRLIDSSGSTTVLRLAGELDLGNAEQLSTLLGREAGRARRIVLDVSALGFCDCAGLQAILYGRDSVQADGGDLVLSGVTPALARLLTVTHLNDALTLDTSEQPVV